MSKSICALLALGAVLILAGPNVLTVIAIIIALGLMELVLRLCVFVVKSIFRWMFGE